MVGSVLRIYHPTSSVCENVRSSAVKRTKPVQFIGMVNSDVREENFERVIFSHNQGQGIISETKDILIDKTPGVLKLGNTSFDIGDSITLDGFFDFPHEFVGSINNNRLIFYCGSDANLFETHHYFKVICYISPTRIFVMYTEISGRDYNWVNGIWK